MIVVSGVMTFSPSIHDRVVERARTLTAETLKEPDCGVLADVFRSIHENSHLHQMNCVVLGLFDLLLLVSLLGFIGLGLVLLLLFFFLGLLSS